MDLGLEGKVAAVCGAGAGIGRASALALAAEGCALVLGGRGAEPLEQTAAAAADHDVPIQTVPADLTTTEGIGDLIAAVDRAYGRLDVLVCCVGGTPLGGFGSVGDEAWHTALEGKFLATARMLRAALPMLGADDGGSVVIVAGNAARTVPPQMVTSAVVNAGLERLASALAADYGPVGIAVNCVSPGPTRTARYDGLLAVLAEEHGSRDEAERALLSRVPDGRPAEPEEVAATVTFLASPVARHINGVTLFIDGGER